MFFKNSWPISDRLFNKQDIFKSQIQWLRQRQGKICGGSRRLHEPPEKKTKHFHTQKKQQIFEFLSGAVAQFVGVSNNKVTACYMSSQGIICCCVVYLNVV